MTTSRVSPRARRRLQGVAALFCVFFLASCRAILGTDDYKGSVDLLCNLLARCFDDNVALCRQIIATDLTDANASVREEWLTAFSRDGCYKRCASARRCLNILPLCSYGACERREDCCGFVDGQRDCSPVTNSCCVRRGARCSKDDDCCAGTGKCTNEVCGGVECGEFGAPCTVGVQCCTGVCKDGACAQDICFDDGFECDDHEDCCNKFCNPDSNTCGDCGLETATCGVDAPCCGELVCRGGTCSNPDCFSEGVDCAEDAQCCGKRCDPKLFTCISCKEAEAPCEGSGECCSGLCEDKVCVDCLAIGDACPANGKTCCSGVCSADGVCAPVCGEVGCTHSACVTGPPLSASMCVDDPCVKIVCAEDKYCCCEEWDSLCVSEALSLCENPCP